WVVDLVGGAGGQRRQGRLLFRLHQARLTLAERGQLAALLRVAPGVANRQRGPAGQLLGAAHGGRLEGTAIAPAEDQGAAGAPLRDERHGQAGPERLDRRVGVPGRLALGFLTTQLDGGAGRHRAPREGRGRGDRDGGGRRERGAGHRRQAQEARLRL